MKAAEIDLSAMLEFEPDSGRLTLGKDRMLVFRQDAMAELRCLLIEHAGEWLVQRLLRQAALGHRDQVCRQGR